MFLFLEIISFSITASNRGKERVFFLNSSNFISSIIYNNSFKIVEYFSLRRENNSLLKENIELKNKLKLQDDTISLVEIDTTRRMQYRYVYGKVIKNSIISQNNYITVNRGKSDGIVPDMAVVNSNGVVGIVTNVSKNYCIVLSVLNTLNSIGCKLKETQYFGSATWDAKNYRQLLVNGIPNHIEVKKGDTIVTSGFGYIFPENILLGTVDSLWKNHQNNFYTIRLNLSVDMKKISNVYLIKNLLQEEQQNLEQETIELLE